MVRTHQRFLISIAVLLGLAACGQTTSAPTRSASTAAALGPPATPLAPATVLPRTAVPTSGGTLATTPSVAPATRAIAASAALESNPDYVRYVAPAGELWVTEPDREQIEVFGLSNDTPPTLVHLAAIAVKGGPESLIIDPQRQRAYTHLWDGATVAIDLNSRTLSRSGRTAVAAPAGLRWTPHTGGCSWAARRAKRQSWTLITMAGSLRVSRSARASM